MAASGASSLGSMEEIKKIFDKFDKNGDGKISGEELSEILSAFGSSTTSSDEVNRIMQEMDKDGDGYIDFDEFVVFYCGGGGGGGGGSGGSDNKDLKDAFDLYDLDKNGLISVRELHAVMKKLGEKCSFSDCVKMIKQVDKDGDGSVNFDEFKKMMSNS